MSALLITLALVVHAAEVDPSAEAAETPTDLIAVERSKPAPLPERPFVMPEAQRGLLSNGLEVVVVPNTEVPLFAGRVVLRLGPDVDPRGKEGLRSVTFDMMNEGADGLDAADLAKAQKRLGGSIGSGAGRDAATVSVSGPTKNLEPLLDLWADVLLRPDFPADAWSVMQAKRIEDLAAARENPSQIARRAGRVMMYGDSYSGRLASTAAYEAIKSKDIKKLHKKLVRPDRAILMFGGDVTLAELQPMLEARLAKWKGRSKATESTATPRAFEREVVYVVDKPGTAQAVLRAALPVGSRLDADHYDFYMGNTALGGSFSARINMNLREDKGWTYGARCAIDHTYGPSIFLCYTDVQIDQTVPSLLELRRELTEVVADRPITAEEIAFFQGYRVNAFQTAYETPESLLGQLEDIWVYGLPADRLERYIPSVQAVTADSANTALTHWIDPGRISYLIVGDKTQFSEALAATGLEVVELDRDGRVLAK